MKNRDYKNFGLGEYYHVYNRGNDKRDIFLDDQDLGFFMMRLKQNLFGENYKGLRSKPLPAGSFSLVSYCLMPNHFHLLIRQNTEIPTTKLMQKLSTSYSIYFNKKHECIGHVFQDQYKQVSVGDDKYLIWLSAYIHQNPKVAGLVADPKDYKWSSYKEFTEGINGICDKNIVLDQFGSVGNYSSFVRDTFETIKKRKEIEHLFLDS